MLPSSEAAFCSSDSYIIMHLFNCAEYQLSRSLYFVAMLFVILLVWHSYDRASAYLYSLEIVPVLLYLARLDFKLSSLIPARRSMISPATDGLRSRPLCEPAG